ncbi:MAG: hypothetical protein EBW93_07220, partial [Betaproteobacteria bacterium]|nr:hypothetical protein [Betaproteobacteria bacterium]
MGTGGTGGSGIGGDACGGSGCSGIDTSATANTGSGGGANGNLSQGGSSGAGATGIVVVNYSYSSSSYAEHNLTISSGAGTVDLNGDVANIGTLSVTTTSSDSDISGVISTDTIVTKAGAGTLTLSGTNTYTGQTNINAGTLAVTVNDALGTNAAGTVIASGATLDLQNVTYSTTEAITNNGGTLSTSTGTSAYAGTMTLGADS